MVPIARLMVYLACTVWTPLLAADLKPVACEGSYSRHLQGVVTDQQKNLYWCFTTTVVKTDLQGKVVHQAEVANHHGDLCYHDGKLFVAVNLGPFNDPSGSADSWVYVYDAADLTRLTKHKLPDIIYGAGGIAHHDRRFFVVGGLPKGADANLVFEYDANFKLVTKHTLSSGYTTKGIQTATFANDRWWFGCYGNPAILLTADVKLGRVQRFKFDANLGLVPAEDGKFLIARGEKTKDKRHTARLVLAETNRQLGLRLVDE